MTINKKMAAAGNRFGARCFGDDDGIAISGAELSLKAETAAMLDEPLGAGAHVGAMFGLSGDTAKADVVAEFVHKAWLIALEVVQNVIHARKYWESAAKAKRIEGMNSKKRNSKPDQRFSGASPRLLGRVHLEGFADSSQAERGVHAASS